MNFELGFYKTRDNSIVELTELNYSNWDADGNSLSTDELDLMEYLKVKENGLHEGNSIEQYIKEISKK